MFEIPEYVTLARQINNTLAGKMIQKGALGNSPHKFVWYNVKPIEFETITEGKLIGTAYSKGRWLFIPLHPGYVLVFGECGGKIHFHNVLNEVPQKYHLLLTFTDETALSVMTQMWGAMEIYKSGEENERQYIKDMRPTPLDKEFTFDYFYRLVESYRKMEKRSVKSLLTQDQIIPGLGNSIAQDIMFNAHLHPKHSITDLSKEKIQILYEAIMTTINDAIEAGGRNDEYDLYGKRGQYKRLLSKDSITCIHCGSKIEKIQYLGGASYYCPTCQV